MSEPNNSVWPFADMEDSEELDVNAIFGSGSSDPGFNPFDTPEEQSPAPAPGPAEPTPEPPAELEPQAPPAPAAEPKTQKEPAPKAQKSDATPAEGPDDLIQAAFNQQEEKATQAKAKSLFEKSPVFVHKSARETIEDASMTFEELRIRKSEDFVDLEDVKCVSWTVEYCGIRKEIKDPKGTTIISMKETIERSREFLDALKKAKDKNPDCLVRPKVTSKNKGIASYKGLFQTVEAARNSDKVICLIPSGDGRFYELRKTEQGEFIAPKNNVTEFQTIRAGFTPALPPIPTSLIWQIISFFRSFMKDGKEYEAMAMIYWDKEQKEFFAYIPKQIVEREEIAADLRDCPYDDSSRYIQYADIHSHNSMDAFFSGQDDQDERGTGLYFVVGHLEKFYPDIRARVSCEGAFLEIDPGLVMESLEQDYPREWAGQVVCKQERIYKNMNVLEEWVKKRFSPSEAAT